MLVVPLIERKRDGGTLTPEEWSALVAAYTADRIPDYQMSALLMAVVLRGLERQELAALTDAMLASGQRLAFDSWGTRSEEHTSELQSRLHLVCRLLPEKKNSRPEPSLLPAAHS